MRVETPITFKVFVLTSEVDTPADIPVSCEPSPINEFAVTVPVIVTPELVVSNLFVLFQLSCEVPPL